MKIAPEGVPFIGFFFVLTAVVFFALGTKHSIYWTVIPLILTLFMVYFFRDPERVVPAEPGYISPADGKVLFTEHEEEPQFLDGRRVMKVSIFMSPMNVHVNRVPCDGEVVDVKHKPGSFMAAYRKEASWKNENTALHLKCDEGPDIVVRQVAGFVARRTVCRVGPGDRLKRGERYGLIKFSSRLDVYLPEDVALKVAPGDRVYAGETVLAVRAE
ncbi:MAG: phosphatidylserine decarboxylase family protein [Thermodesulfovibrionales bacterium]|nr:phosphatidylserine decarboxylase family protein [Thermodesulfovibrionales bacterium]